MEKKAPDIKPDPSTMITTGSGNASWREDVAAVAVVLGAILCAVIGLIAILARYPS